MLEWQTLWENHVDSIWTNRLIKEVASSIEREHGSALLLDPVPQWTRDFPVLSLQDR